MIRISVLSSDELFASMLCSEIESMGNDYKLVSKKARMLILDLDSASEIPDAEIIIGFSRNEKNLPEDVRDKCRAVLHRPFLIEDLKKTIKELTPHEKEINFSENKKSSLASLVLDSASSSVELCGEKIHLSKNEYAILDKLLDNAGLPVSREDLGEALSSFSGNMCDVYVCHLRTKLEKISDKRLIFTVRGKGYMLKV